MNQIYYRVNDYLPENKKNTSASESARHRANRVMSYFPNNTKIHIHSVIKDNSVFLLRRKTYEISKNKHCTVYFTSNNLVGLILKNIASFIISIHLFFLSLKNKNRIIFYNILPTSCLIYTILSFISPTVRKRTCFEIEELYSVCSFSRFKTILFKASELIVFKKFNHFIVVNENIKNRINILNNKSHVVLDFGYNSRTEELNIENKSKKIDRKEKSIVYTGRLDYLGGINILLNAINLLPSIERKTIKITGNGVLKNDVITFCEKSKIKFLGFLSNSDYNDLLKEASIAINPIRTTEEFSNYSFPSKVLQYLEYGCIVISSNCLSPYFLSFFKEYIVTYKNDSEFELSEKIIQSREINVNKNEVIEHYIFFMKQQKEIVTQFFLSINFIS